jgi:hypothetical protein
VAEGEFTVILLTIDNAGEGTGSEMAEADNPFGLTLDLFERREYNRHKHRDNGDDNKQLYERKTLAHFTSPNGLYPVDDLQTIPITSHYPFKRLKTTITLSLGPPLAESISSPPQLLKSSAGG